MAGEIRVPKFVLGGNVALAVGASAPAAPVTGTLWLDTGAAAISPQPLDSDLTDIAALAPADDSFIQRKSGVWVARTLAQVRADIATATAPITYSGGVIAIPAAAAPSTNGYMSGASQAKLDAVTMYNEAVNGGMEVKQRTAATFTANGAVTLDRWVIALTAPSTVSVSQITSTIGYPGKSMQIAYTHSGVGSVSIFQNIEDVLKLRGKPITLSATIKATNASRCAVYLADGITSAASSLNVGTSEERVSVTFTPNATATILQAAIYVSGGSCTVEVNDLMLVVGSVASPFVPLFASEDMARCERYYQIVFCTARFTATAASQVCETPLAIRVPMGGTPTATLQADGSVGNMLTLYPQVANVTDRGGRFVINSAAAGDTYCVVRSLILEYNP